MDKANLSQTSADFFSENYRLSCTIDARKRSLGDMLYDTTSFYLTIEDAYISPINYPARISMDFPSAIVIKENLTFALTSNRDTVFRRDQRYGQYYVPDMKKIFVALPYFEITGDLFLPGRISPQVLLVSETEKFITLLNVSAQVLSNPEIVYKAEACIVSKDKVSFIGLLDN